MTFLSHLLGPSSVDAYRVSSQLGVAVALGSLEELRTRKWGEYVLGLPLPLTGCDFLGTAK